MKYNILFHAINTLWYGHIARSFNIIKSLQDSTDLQIKNIYLASSCEKIITWLPWVQYRKLDAHIDSYHMRKYKKVTETQLWKIIIQDDIQIMFHDTFYIWNIITQYRHIDHYLILRNTNIDYLLGISDEIQYFRCVFIPHLEEELSFELQQFYKQYSNIKYIWYFRPYFYDSSLNISRTISRKHTLCITPWFWASVNEIYDFLSYISQILDGIEFWEIHVFVWSAANIIQDLESKYPKWTFFHSFWKDYYSIFSRSNIIIWRWWYNTILESIFYKKKGLFFSADRRFESQYERILFFSKYIKGKSIQAWSYNFDEDIWILRLLTGEIEAYDIAHIFTANKIFSDFISYEYRKEKILFFQDSHLELSQNFIIDELKELHHIFDISIFTFFLESNSLTKNNLRIFHDTYFQDLFLKYGHSEISTYSQYHKNILEEYIQHMIFYIKRFDIKMIYCPFIWDVWKIMFLKQVFPELKIFWCARWNDIYNYFSKYSHKKQKNIIHVLDAVFPRDTHMKEYMKKVGFNEQKIHIVRSGKDISIQEFNGIKQKRSVVVWGRIVEKKWILETLQLLAYILAIYPNLIEQVYFLGNLKMPPWMEKQQGDSYQKLVVDFLREHQVGLHEEDLFLYKYSLAIYKIIHSSPQLKKKIVFTWFLDYEEYMNILYNNVNIFIWNFKIGRNNDMDGIPNVILDNIIAKNIVFSTSSWWIKDIIIDNHTGYMLSGNYKKDAKKIYKVLSEDKYNAITTEAYDLLREEFLLSKQIDRLKNIFSSC